MPSTPTPTRQHQPTTAIPSTRACHPLWHPVDDPLELSVFRRPSFGNLVSIFFVRARQLIDWGGCVGVGLPVEWRLARTMFMTSVAEGAGEEPHARACSVSVTGASSFTAMASRVRMEAKFFPAVALKT